MIRAGTPEELPAIVVVRTAVRENHLSVAQMAELGITPVSIAARMTSGDLGCWVAEEGGRIVAFSMADRTLAEVFALFVDPAHEQRGFGSALLAAAEVWLGRHGHDRARLTTAAGSRAFGFYRRRGWEATGETSALFAEDAVLEKRLR